MTIDEMRKRLDCCSWYEGYGLDEDDIRNLLNRVEELEKENEKIKTENPEFWDLYDRYQNKIAEKLQLKDEVERLKKENEELIMEMRISAERSEL